MNFFGRLRRPFAAARAAELAWRFHAMHQQAERERFFRGVLAGLYLLGVRAKFFDGADEELDDAASALRIPRRDWEKMRAIGWLLDSSPSGPGLREWGLLLLLWLLLRGRLERLRRPPA